MTRLDRRLPLIPRIILGAFAVLAISWLAFMLHYVLVGSKHRPRPDPLYAPSSLPTNGAKASETEHR